MHDVDSRGLRYSLAAAGWIASMFGLVGSAWLNFRFGHTLARTPTDGMIFGVLAIVSDVFMATSLFYLFEAKKRRQWAQVLAALTVWIFTTFFAGIAAVSQASVNRMDAVAARANVTMSFQDTREELTQARRERGFIPQHRPEATMQAEMEKHKANRLWSVSNECSDATGSAQRTYCSTYATLKAEMGYAQQATKLDARISDLVAKSDKAMASNASIASEADPSAASFADATGWSQRRVQTVLSFGFASLIIILCSLGPYITSSMLGSSPSGARTTIDGEATDITPSPEPITLEVAPLAIAPPLKLVPIGLQKARGGKNVPQVREEPTPEWRALLTSLAFPESTSWTPPRDGRGQFILRARDADDVVGYRYWAWLLANNEVGEFTGERLWELYQECANLDFREPWKADRIILNRLRNLNGKYIRYGGNPVAYEIRPVPAEKVKELLSKRKVPMFDTVIALEATPAETPQDTAVTVTATQAAPEDTKPNGIKAIALRKFFRGTDPASETDVTLN